MTEDSNTGENRKRGQFTKGDPRINRKGRPKSFDALRELAQQIGHEEALVDGEPLVISGHRVTVTEKILREWADGRDRRLQQAFIEIAYGKVPDKVDVTTAGEKLVAIDGDTLAEALRILGS